MKHTERQKKLYAKMGWRWDDSWRWHCENCDKDIDKIRTSSNCCTDPLIPYDRGVNLDLCDWPGFGKIKTEMESGNDWQRFIERYGTCYYPERITEYNQKTMWMLPDYLIHPERFCLAVCDFYGIEEG